MLHDNIVKITENLNKELVENLTQVYKPNRFLYNLQPFLLWDNKIFDFFKSGD